jgi:hypothetical protein
MAQEVIRFGLFVFLKITMYSLSTITPGNGKYTAA